MHCFVPSPAHLGSRSRHTRSTVQLQELQQEPDRAISGNLTAHTHAAVLPRHRQQNQTLILSYMDTLMAALFKGRQHVVVICYRIAASLRNFPPSCTTKPVMVCNLRVEDFLCIRKAQFGAVSIRFVNLCPNVVVQPCLGRCPRGDNRNKFDTHGTTYDICWDLISVMDGSIRYTWHSVGQGLHRTAVNDCAERWCTPHTSECLQDTNKKSNKTFGFEG